MLDDIKTNNDLKRVSARPPDFDTPTLYAIGRNEMIFLPEFLNHYRSLGIEQFAILDDRSDDGTTEHLLDQEDVVVFRSGFKYGDTVEIPDLGKRGPFSNRILYIWRSILFQMFAKHRWAVQVDLDEFLQLPVGMRLQDIEQRLDNSRHSLVYGLMLDVYPKLIDELSSADADRGLDLSVPVYFDAEPHLKLRRKRYPKILHPGARARLYHSFGMSDIYKEERAQRRVNRWTFWRRLGTPSESVIPRYNTLQKPVFSKWPDNAFFQNSHRTNFHATERILLPLIHYRFTSNLCQRIEVALSENSYSSNSRDHRLLSALLEKMADQNADFLYPRSSKFGTYQDLADSGNAFGL